MTTKSELDEFFAAYIECALWSSTGDDDQPLDSNYSADDLAEETREYLRAVCLVFHKQYGYYIAKCEEHNSKYSIWERAGHDLWLTQNGHGAGFWDRDYLWKPYEKMLTVAAERMGEVDLYVGDDGLIYC